MKAPSNAIDGDPQPLQEEHKWDQDKGLCSKKLKDTQNCSVAKDEGSVQHHWRWPPTALRRA